MPENMNEVNQGYQVHQLQQSLTGYAPSVGPAAPPAYGGGAAPRSYGSTQQAQSGGYAGAGAQGAASGVGTALGIPDFSLMTDAQIDEYVRVHYPTYAWAFADPVIGKILRDAARAKTDPAEVESQIENTDWWKNTTITARQWQQLNQTDPATAKVKLQDKINEIANLNTEAQLGLSDQQIAWEANASLNLGWPDATLRQQLIKTAQMRPGWQQTLGGAGSLQATADQVRQIAAQYLMPIGADQAQLTATDIWSGKTTLDTVRGNYGAMATQAYGATNPQFADAISRGITPRAFIDPQIQMVASQLEMGADQIDPLDPRWSKIINYDNGNGQLRMMTVPEAGLFARQQPEFKTTQQANDKADARIAGLLQTMGAVKF